MTFLTRFKYLLGVLLVAGAVAALTLHANTRISTVRDVSATVKSHDYTVGTPYSGVVVGHYVDQGDQVDKGDEMFVVKSNQLARDIANDAVDPHKSPFDIRDGNKLIVRAVSPGKVSSSSALQGEFVAANTTLARVQVKGSGYVQADFRLTPKEYALMRRADRATIVLPNQRQLTARITEVNVHTSGDQAVTRVRAKAPQLNNEGIFATGTPVDMQVRLRKDGLVHSVEAAVRGLLTPSGES
jgi:multidrug resistance efflux pump